MRNRTAQLDWYSNNAYMFFIADLDNMIQYLKTFTILDEILNTKFDKFRCKDQ